MTRAGYDWDDPQLHNLDRRDFIAESSRCEIRR